jgi:hypothetical protein
MPKHLTTNDEDLFLQADQIGEPNGVAGLDGTGHIPEALLPGGSTSPVTSVNGELGNVVLDASDVGAVPAASVGANNGVAPLDSAGRLPVAKLPVTAVQSVNGYTGPTVALTAADLGSITQSAADLRYVRLDHMWINVKQKGALGDNVTNDTAAINSAIAACPAGGTVYFPAGAYRTLSPIVVPPGITLLGTHTNLMLVTGLYDPNCSVKPLAGFTGDAVFKFLDQPTGSYAAISGEQRILNLMIDGTNAPAGVDGIQAKGNIQNVGLRDVTIKRMTGNGIYTGSNAGAYPYSWRMFRVMLDNNTSHGMTVQQMTDLTMVDCQAIGNGANGFVLNNIANSQLGECRAEWNGNHGYHLTGSWGTGTGSGGMQMSNCGTDRNGFNGVFIDATGNAPIVISTLMTRRDGRNGGAGGGGYAGLNANAATVPVIIGDWTNYPGVDDNGTGTNSPQYGASFTGNTFIQLDNAYLHANTGGLNNGGGNTVLQLGANVAFATGATTAPTRTVPQNYLPTTGSTATTGRYSHTGDGTNNGFEWKDTGGTITTRIGGNGNLVAQGTAYAVAGVQFGATTAAFGGAAGGVIGITNATTPPSSNPSGGAVLYADSGLVKVRQSNGTTVTVGTAVGIAGARYVAASNATAAEKAKADYVCDGTADNVEIQAAIDAAQTDGGGVVILSPGTFQIAATLIVNGTTGNENNAKTVTLRGCGQQVTKLNVAANVIGLTISNWAQIHLEKLCFFVSGSGIAIKSVGVTSGDTLSFWHSSFRDLRINGGFTPTDTSWGMWLEMPWRSVFENIEIEGTRNGMRIVNDSAVQNAGDCTFTRFFVEIVGNDGYGLYFDSIDGNMNQNNFSMFEAGANGTGCTGIYLGGTVGTASQRFWGTNLEQFKYMINVANGESNVFDLNYVTCDTGQTGNKAFMCGSGSYNNTFSAKWVNIAAADTLQIIEDLNTTSNTPNIFERIRIENNTTSTVTYTKSSSSVFRDITTFNTGNAMPAGLLQYPLSTVNDAEFTAQDHGFVGWTSNPGTMSGSGFQLATGTVYLSKIKIVDRSTLVSNITYYVAVAGTSLTAAQCFVGLYNSSGTRLALSADQATNLASTGSKTAALTAAQTLAVGTYYVAFLANFSGTVPNLSGSGGNSGVTNVGLTTATSRSLNTAAGNTSLPTSITLGSQSQNIAVRWAGLS